MITYLFDDKKAKPLDKGVPSLMGCAFITLKKELLLNGVWKIELGVGI